MPHYLVVGPSLVTLATHKPDYILPVDGDFRKVDYFDNSDDGGRRVVAGKLDAGRALKPEHMPTRLKRVDPYPQGLSDLYSASFGYFVSDRFKALVERFEPGVHQFFPMTVKSGNKPLGTLYYFNICNRIDGMDHDACIPPIRPGDRTYHGLSQPGEKLVLSARKTAGVHIWRDMRRGDAFISDAFAAAMVEEGLVGATASNRLPEVE
jgi:hypothetical protein